MRIDYNYIIGNTFGWLTVLELSDKESKKQKLYKCECKCGNITYVRRSNLLSGHTKSCGCYRSTTAMSKHKLYGVLNNMKRSRHKVDKSIDLDFLYELYLKQEGRDYYTGLPLNLDLNDSNAYSVSVDRIDSSKSYTRENIVLTCRNVNLWKNDMQAEDFIAMIQNLKDQNTSDIPFFKIKNDSANLN